MTIDDLKNVRRQKLRVEVFQGHITPTLTRDLTRLKIPDEESIHPSSETCFSVEI